MPESVRPRTVTILALWICIAAVAVNAFALYRPVLFCDDFQILVQSWTWSAARNNLWLPSNEHTMPLGRLTTWVQARAAYRQTLLPLVLTLQGPLAVVVGMVLLYFLVRRELGHPFYGLLAMALFGVTSVYQQAVFWFSASFSILSLDTMLLGLLAAQGWRQTGRWMDLLLCAVWAALAPGWFAIGILAGPLCCLYLLPQEEEGWTAWRRRGLALVPLLGSVVFLAVSLPRTAQHILHLEHYGEKTAVQAFHPLTGILYTNRSIVDNLLLGSFGIGEVVCPPLLAHLVLVVVVAFGVWWWYGAPQRRLILLGVGCIVTGYVLVYSARAEWSYDIQLHSWSRYHLVPQLGLALFVCGGLTRWQGQGLPGPGETLSRGQGRFLTILLAILFLTQLPHGVIGAWHWCESHGELLAGLRQIEEMDARCRRYHIAAATARAVLPPVEVPGSLSRENGWELLRGSPDPRSRTPEEVRRLLEERE